MANIRYKNTKIEHEGFKLLREIGFSYRRHPKNIFGHPDAANKQRKVAIFFDSSFWHGRDFHLWKKRLPQEYWRNKINRNIKRDTLVTKTLKKEGWLVIRIWDYEIIEENFLTFKKVFRKINRR